MLVHYAIVVGNSEGLWCNFFASRMLSGCPALEPPSSVRSFALLAGLVAGVLVLAPGAHAARPAPNVHTGSVYVPDEVIVRYAPTRDRTVRASAQRSTGTGQPHVFAPRTRVLKIRDGESVAQTIAELERRPGVLERDAEPDRAR